MNLTRDLQVSALKKTKARHWAVSAPLGRSCCPRWHLHWAAGRQGGRLSATGREVPDVLAEGPPPVPPLQTGTLFSLSTELSSLAH